MKKIALFGGSGGLGTKLTPLLEKKYNVIKLSSKDIDVRDLEALKLFFGKNDIDIVINMSGYNFDNFLHKLDGESEIQDMLDINIKGNINILSCCLPKMRARQYGRIILFSSVLAKKVVLGTSLYSGSKAFIDNLVKTSSAENIGRGITCNSLQLGYFDGGMCHRLPEKYVEPIKQSIGLKRWGTVEELFNTLDFLINVEYITGQNINISGGLQ
ncbi:SDR family oxidoreductase [Nonlabens sp.]|uniref:SDR family NAD(P)-dependent oxidoreductase n=1 Tax=Nonlabens sp. TaxID=1888209 RepID=UPI001BCD7DC0|nr:SDR family oxidoreductase [Nonlabens sp.]